MERKSTTALLLAAMMVGGLAYASAGQRAFAHNFSGDESASFLANVETIKIHLMLVGGDYPHQVDFAADHAGHAIEHLDNSTIKEITERNARLGTDLPAALAKLESSVKGNSPRSDIVQQIKGINGLLGETVKIRIDNAQLSNSTVQALKFAGVVNEILEAYNGAYGVDASSGDSHSSMNMTANSGMNSTSSMGRQPHDKIVDMASYQSAQWLVLKASSMYNGLNAVAPTGSDASMAKLRAGLDELKSAIANQKSVDDVTVILHGKVHQNLMEAFHLPMASEAPAAGHDHTTDEKSGQMSGNMTGNMTGGSMQGNKTQ
jgi:hypothetical protein